MLFTAQKVIEKPFIARKNFSNTFEVIAQSHDAVCPLTYSNGCPASKQMSEHGKNPAGTAKFGYAATKTALGVRPVHQGHPKLHRPLKVGVPLLLPGDVRLVSDHI
jgi:hypothetical protein